MQTIDINKIEKLSRLYFDGKTTRREENELRELLDRIGDDDIPDNLREDFDLLRDILSLAVPDELARRLDSTIDKLAEMEPVESVVQPSLQPENKASRFRVVLWWCSSVAAAVVLAVMLFPLANDKFFDNGEIIADSSACSLVQSLSDIKNIVDKEDTGSYGVASADIAGQSTLAGLTEHPEKSVGKSTGTANRPLSRKADSDVEQRQAKVREVTDSAEVEMLLNRAFSRVYRNMVIAQSSINNATRPVASETRAIDNLFQNEEKL